MSAVHAQREEFVLKGVVFKNGTTQRVGKALVADMRNNALVNTDDLGSFEIKCAIGDSILIRQKDYADQKIGILNQNTVMVYLQSVINLREVSIREASKKQQLQQVMGEYNSQGIYAGGKPSVASAILSPLNGLYDLLGSGPKQARRFGRYSANELEQTEVDRHFTRTLVKQVTGLKDTDKIQEFMLGNRPSYQDIKKWNQYELMQYIKKQYSYFESHGETSPALPRLFLTDTVRLGGKP